MNAFKNHQLLKFKWKVICRSKGTEERGDDAKYTEQVPWIREVKLKSFSADLERNGNCNCSNVDLSE